MKKLLNLIACVALVNATAVQLAYGAQSADMTVAQIVEKNAKARGGLEAWRAVSSMTMSGEMDAGGKKNTMLPFVLSLKRPYKNRLEIRFQDQAAVQVYDGSQGWKVRPFLGRDDVEPFSPAEAKVASGWPQLDGPLMNHAAKGTKVELLGTEEVEGNNAYKLKLTMKNGEQRNLWIDAKTFLEAKIDGDPRKIDGKLRNVAIYYRDFKKVNGLTLPYVTETVVDGINQTHKMSIQTVTLNPQLDDTIFAKPKLNLATTTDR